MEKNKLNMIFFPISLAIFFLPACGGSGGGDDEGGNGKLSNSVDGLPEESITASLMFDADNDGDQDIVLGGHFDQPSDMLLVNNGAGKFSIKASALPNHYLGKEGATVNFAAADFNKDGRLDLIATTVDIRSTSFYKSARVHLYFGNGDATFTDVTGNVSNNIFTDEWIEWIRIGDIDTDGNLDIALVGSGCSQPTTQTDAGSCRTGSIYLNDGLGNFSLANIKSVDTPNPYVNKTYLFDKLVWGNGGGLRIVSDLFLGDVNNDGRIDIVAANGYAQGAIATFINRSTPGDLNFDIVLSYQLDKPNPPYGTTQFKNGALLDINADGLVDIIGSKSIGAAPLYAFINHGEGLFVEDNSIFKPSQPAVVHARQWIVADFNKDGRSDLFVADHGLDSPPFPGHSSLLLLSDGSGNLVDVTAANLSTASAFTHGASVGDVNGDGAPDLFLNNWAGTETRDREARLWINTGNGGFRPETSILQ